MTECLSIGTPISHSPRPTTTIMSTSPSGPRAILEVVSATRCEGNLDSDESAQYPQLFMLGDSITQFGTLTLQAYLQTAYIRRLDVINRGYSGYTSVMGLKALQKALPSNVSRPSRPSIKVITIFFGANDACVQGEAQHIELHTYESTIKTIVSYAASCRSVDGELGIIVITPPPISEHQLGPGPSGTFQRRAGITSQYARAAVEAAKSSGVCVLDFWTILMSQVGWNESMGRECCCERIPYSVDLDGADAGKVQHIPGCIRLSESIPDAKYQLSDFLADGLHLTKLGYDILFTELMKLIRVDLPDCAPEHLPYVLPDWKDVLNIPSI